MIDGRMEHFKTDSVSPPARLSFWNELASDTFSPMSIDPASGRFGARLARKAFGDIGYAQVASSPATVHGRPGPGDEEGSVFLLLQTGGSSRTLQNGREVVLAPGEASLCVSSRPYDIAFDHPNVMTVVKLPAGRVRRRFTDPERLVGQVMPQGRSAMLAGLLAGIAASDDDGHDAEAAQTVGDVLVDLIALACRPSEPAARCSPAEHRWREEMQGYVHRHITEPGLGAVDIADALGVTPRYVQMIFAGMGETCSSYVLNRRLSLAARQLRGAPEATITDVALDVGFNDLSYFARRFRRRFGMAPRQYRARRGAAAASD